MSRSKPSPSGTAATKPQAAWPYIAGVVLLALCSLFSLMLVLEHVGGMSLPGCREGGACEKAANSIYGSVPLGSFHWPTAYVGLAYFGAMLLTWILARGKLPLLLRWVVRLGALASLGFTALILTKSMLCPYCIGTHLGNFAFWILLERGRGPEPAPKPQLIRFAAFFAGLTLILALVDGQHRASVAAKAEKERSAAAERMIAAGQEKPAETSAAPGTTASSGQPPAGTSPAAAPGAPSPANSAPKPAETPAAQARPTPPVEKTPEANPSGRPLFIGRYPAGPEVAPIRIVIFMGYQCPDCYLIEHQLTDLMATRNDISVSVKNFPFCSDCNPHISHTSQANGCWAARAAEAAGILWGADGFWKMHKFLFDRRGTFMNLTDLAPGFKDPAYSPDQFAQTMTSEETLRRVRQDCNEADSLGLFFTPMIFVNGVELKGWSAPDALKRTVLQVAASNPAPRRAGTDYPPVAMDKLVEDLRDEPLRAIPAEAHTWTRGPKDAAQRLIFWGDYQEPGCKSVDSLLKIYMASHKEVSLTFRHYPFNQDCNPKVPDRRFANACKAALAAEAAGSLGGNEAFWKMHDWLMARKGEFDDAALSAAAPGLGLDGAALLAAMQKDEVKAMVHDDVHAGDGFPTLRIGVPPGIFAIPTIFVNERYLPRWMRGDKNVLPYILEHTPAK
jgi:protein-disulfide isomerase/uncharacterized membrane protein